MKTVFMYKEHLERCVLLTQWKNDLDSIGTLLSCSQTIYNLLTTSCEFERPVVFDYTMCLKDGSNDWCPCSFLDNFYQKSVFSSYKYDCCALVLGDFIICLCQLVEIIK